MQMIGRNVLSSSKLVHYYSIKLADGKSETVSTKSVKIHTWNSVYILVKILLKTKQKQHTTGTQY